MQIKDIKVTDPFWTKYRDIVKNELIPYQWSVINDDKDIAIEKENAGAYDAVEQSHAVENLKIAAGLAKGHFYGFWFQDSDVYKWLEAVAYALRYAPDAELEGIADSLIDIIARAQEPDGYLDTYIQIEAPTHKWTHVSLSHELYVMGHYIEAGVAYYQTAGNQKALAIAKKMGDCIDANFGPEENKMHGYPGHPEVELALAKLADETGDAKYTRVAKYMIDQRGTHPNNFFEEQLKNVQTKKIEDPYFGDASQPDPDAPYFQNDVPVRDMQSAEGHAVRMMYLLTGMAHVARQTGDESLMAACQRLWEDITQRQMYVTGGIGSSAPNGEAFTFDYDLPNDTAYAETCASCAMAFFAKQMRDGRQDADYGDVLERELYNGTISGMSLDGEHFFYVNPPEVDPEASAKDPMKSHVKVQRAAWFGCACCPPNLARLVASVDQYIYTVTDDAIYADQFIGNETTFDNGVTIAQSGNFPWSGEVTFQVRAAGSVDTTLAIRIPAWSRHNYQVTVAGKPYAGVPDHGYLKIKQTWSGTTTITVSLDMSVQEIHADPRIKDDVGKVAIQRGPVVYALEEADNGKHLQANSVAADAQFTVTENNSTFAVPTVQLTTTGTHTDAATVPGTLYGASATVLTHAQPLVFIPYFAWANRTPGEMMVWVHPH